MLTIALLKKKSESRNSLCQYGGTMLKLFYIGLFFVVTQLAIAEVKIYPAPKGEAKFENVELKVNGKAVDVYKCLVSKYPINQEWSGYQRPIEQAESAGFAYWDMGEGDCANIEITTTLANCRSVTVRPLSLGIKPQFKKNKITFKLDKIKPIVVEINGYHHALHLFPSKTEDFSSLEKTTLCSPQCSYCATSLNEIPKNRNHNYYYFGAGRHDVGTLILKSNDHVHIEAGAVVYGSFVADDAENIKITGRGILDGSKIERADKWSRGGFGCLHFRNCKNISVSGVILRDPNSWCINVRRCVDVDIFNIKLIGLWRYNSDGIDVWDSSNVSFRDSFIRSFDDSFIVRTDNINNKNIEINNCVIWNDWSLSLAIRAYANKSKGKVFENISFKNIDVIRATGRVMQIINKSASTVRNVKFENINIEYDAWSPRRVIQNKENKNELYVPDPNDKAVYHAISIDSREKNSAIENISYNNINVVGRNDVPSAIKSNTCPIKNVSIKNLKINGKLATDARSANMKINNAENVTFE